MECFDTAVGICSYLSQCEAMEFANVSRLCRRAAQAHVGEAEFRYFTGECTREDYVELAPPCRVVGIMFVEPSHQLVVLGRSEVCSGDVECFLNIQEYLADGDRCERRIDLPATFASLSCAPWFEGHRFLCGTTRDDVPLVFDCATEMLLEVPFGMEAFRASPSGHLCVVDVGRHLYFCPTASCVSVWWEMQHAKTVFGRSGLVSTPPPMPTRLRGQLDVSCATYQHPLGNSSAAWHNCWVGNSSVVYAHEDGVTLFYTVTPPLRPGVPATTVTADGGADKPADAITFEAVNLRALTTASSVLSNSSRSDVAVLPSGGDEYVFLTCRNFQLHVVRTRGRPSALTAHGQGPDAPFELLTTDLQPLLPPHCGVKGIAIVDPGRVYMAHVQHAHEDHTLFFSADLTLHRWVAIGRPSYVTLHRAAGVLVAAPIDLIESTSDHHLLLEAVEGGVGTVICFINPSEVKSCPRASADQSAEVTVVTAATGSSGGSGSEAESASGLYAWLSSSNRETAALSGVEALSWVAFGIVSASLIWTLSALCYNGWWLHLQLLFCGKIA